MFSVRSTVEAVANNSAILGAFPHVIGRGTGVTSSFIQIYRIVAELVRWDLVDRRAVMLGKKPETTKNKKISTSSTSSSTDV